MLLFGGNWGISRYEWLVTKWGWPFLNMEGTKMLRTKNVATLKSLNTSCLQTKCPQEAWGHF